MAVKCPSCKNDLYRPFTYCESCGWEAEGKDLEKSRKLEEKENKSKNKDLSKRRKDMTDKYLKREKKLGRDVPGGGKKREDDYEDLDDNEFKDIFGEFDNDEDLDDEDEYSTSSSRDRGRSSGDDEEGVMIPCKCGNVIKVMSSKRPIRINCPKCGSGGTLKKDPPGAKKIKPEPKEDRPKKGGGNECPECGHKSRGTKFCPECGASLPKPGGRKKERPPPERKRERPPEREKRSNVPSKGKCSKCSGTRLQFKEDGRGRCKECGHKFWWDQSKKPQKGGGGGGGGGGKRPPKCPECRKPMEFVKKYKRFYCWDCNLYED